MVFSLILGMGVPTTANYVITSLVVAPAVFNAVAGTGIYDLPVPGCGVAIALLAAHFFVFYFGILADLTPPVALASYAGSALAGSDFWKTARNAVKYALAGYIGPYIYFTHPEMFLITVQSWDVMTALKVVYYFVASVVVIYLLAMAITGYYRGHIRNELRVLLGILGIAGATLHPIPIVMGICALLGLRLYGGEKILFTKPL
jgi:TRAP-type uncharacterized transport system fused permease subunit